MAQSVIENPGPIFIYQTYHCSYSIGGWAHMNLSAGDFNISAKPGYTIAGCYSFTSGNSETSVVQIASSTSGTVMQLFRKPSSSSSATAYISYLWVKNDYIQ